MGNLLSSNHKVSSNSNRLQKGGIDLNYYTVIPILWIKKEAVIANITRDVKQSFCGLLRRYYSSQ